MHDFAEPGLETGMQQTQWLRRRLETSPSAERQYLDRKFLREDRFDRGVLPKRPNRVKVDCRQMSAGGWLPRVALEQPQSFYSGVERPRMTH